MSDDEDGMSSGSFWLAADYKFERLEGELAIFRDDEVAPKVVEQVRQWIRSGCYRLDCSSAESFTTSGAPS